MPSKDQGSIEGSETTYDKWDRARSLFMESLYKSDHELRACAHNQKCFYELLEIRESMIQYVRDMPNPKPHYIDGDGKPHGDDSPYNNIPERY
jgi:hypothetical protein